MTTKQAALQRELAQRKTTETFELAQREARATAASSLVPEQYRDNVPNVLIAMEVANRIGASVLSVMQSLYIVKGKPSFSSSFLIATVNASGRFTPIRYRWEGTPGKDDWGCRAYAEDRESGEECLGALINWRMVKAEGWNSKNGSKWKTMPEQMFMYRAAAFWQRAFCPELSLGMHTREEMQDVVNAGPARVVSKTLGDLTEELKGETETEVEVGIVIPNETNQEIEKLATKIWGSEYRDKLTSFIETTNPADDKDKLIEMLEIEASEL
jgi:hypothetical protein